MAKRLNPITVMPIQGALNTTDDPALLAPGEFVQLDNVTIANPGNINRRNGINYDYDDQIFKAINIVTTASTRIIHGSFSNTAYQPGDSISFSSPTFPQFAGIYPIASMDSSTIVISSGYISNATYSVSDVSPANKQIGTYVYNWEAGEGAPKQQYLIGVLDNGAVYYVLNDNGERHRLADIGNPYSSISEVNFETAGNNLVIVADGNLNVPKWWNGAVSQPIQNLGAQFMGATDGTLIGTASGTIGPLGIKSIVATGSVRSIVLNGNVEGLSALYTLVSGQSFNVWDVDTNFNGFYPIASVAGSIITYNGHSSVSSYSSSYSSYQAFAGLYAPNGHVARWHGGQLYMDDKANPDFVQYSGEDMFAWGGLDFDANNDQGQFSGGHFVGEGDGDPDGITAITPVFQNNIFVGKRTKLYRIEGFGDAATIIEVSDGIGILAQKACCNVDQDDLMFCSLRGVHSMTTTNAYGDFLASFLSAKIQKSWTKDINRALLNGISVLYLPDIQSIAVSVASTYSDFNDTIYLYNVSSKGWYRWTKLEAVSMALAYNYDETRVFFGGLQGRTIRSDDVPYDTDYEGNQQGVGMELLTGRLSPTGYVGMAAFKTVRILCAPADSGALIIGAQIDNFSQQTQSVILDNGAVPLELFVLNQDVLGGTPVASPFYASVDGIGRAIQVYIAQTGLIAPASILGIVVDCQSEGLILETRAGDDS